MVGAELAKRVDVIAREVSKDSDFIFIERNADNE